MRTGHGQTGPIRIQAQILRNNEASTRMGAMLGFGTMLAQVTKEPREGEGRRRVSWRESDLRRAIAAAEKVGLGSYRVEIAPDGTITIIVGQ